MAKDREILEEEDGGKEQEEGEEKGRDGCRITVLILPKTVEHNRLCMSIPTGLNSRSMDFSLRPGWDR